LHKDEAEQHHGNVIINFNSSLILSHKNYLQYRGYVTTSNKFRRRVICQWPLR